jgi:hypothetical protein
MTDIRWFVDDDNTVHHAACDAIKDGALLQEYAASPRLPAGMLAHIDGVDYLIPCPECLAVAHG